MQNPLTIVVDTREQKPYGFASECATVRRALPAGDYSVEGLEQSVAVERKSLQDLVQTLMRRRRAFARELRALSQYSTACIVVEGTEQDIQDRRYTGGAAPASILGLVRWIERDFQIKVVWAGDRQRARAYTLEFLQQASARLALNVQNVGACG